MSSLKKCDQCEVEMQFDVTSRKYYLPNTIIGHSHCRNCGQGIFWNPDVVSEGGSKIPLDSPMIERQTNEWVYHDCPESDYNKKRGGGGGSKLKPVPGIQKPAPTVPPVQVDKAQQTLAIDAQGALIAISRSFILNNEQNEQILKLLDKISQNIEAMAKTEFSHLVPALKSAGELITDPQKAKQVFEGENIVTEKVTDNEIDWEKESRELEHDQQREIYPEDS